MIDQIKSVIGDAKLRVLCFGAGINISTLALRPGISEVLDGIAIPYSKEAVEQLLEHPVEKMVSEETTFEIADLCNTGENVVSLIVNGAVTTNRFRKGENHAYIAIMQNGITRMQHVTLNKWTEEEYLKKTPDEIAKQRFQDDAVITEVALAYFLNRDVSASLKDVIKEVHPCYQKQITPVS